MGDRICSVEGCERPHKSKGFCSLHYIRWRNHGDPLITERIYGDDVGRFWSKVDKTGPIPPDAPHLGRCWIWLTKSNAPYGDFRVGHRTIKAYRFAYELLIGPVPAGLDLDHLCRITLCVNPDHLEPVTRAENTIRGLGGINQAIKTHCPQGHPYDEANTHRTKVGGRACRACARERERVRKRTRSIVCAECGRSRPHAAKGLCGACYERQRKVA